MKNIIRILLILVLLVFIYMETGVFTTLALFLIAVALDNVAAALPNSVKKK